MNRPIGPVAPFRDRNHNGRYDAFVDPLGYCDAGRRCSFADQRVTVHRLRRNGPAGSSAGVFIWAQGLGAQGPTLDLPVCTVDGECSQPMRLPFDGIERDVHARWICTDEPEQLQFPEFRVGGTAVEVAARPHLRLIVEPRTMGGLTIRSSETIDRMLARVVRFDRTSVREVVWSSTEGPASVQFLDSSTAELDVPSEVRDRCDDACFVMIQVMRVWQNDDRRDVSEAWMTIPLTSVRA